MEIQNYVKLIFRNKWETACQPSCNNCKILPFKDWWPIQRLWRQLDKSKKAWKGFKGPPLTCTRPWGSRGSASVWIWEPQRRRPQEQVRRPRQLLQRPHPPNPTQHSQQLEVREFDFCPILAPFLRAKTRFLRIFRWPWKSASLQPTYATNGNKYGWTRIERPSRGTI